MQTWCLLAFNASLGWLVDVVVQFHRITARVFVRHEECMQFPYFSLVDLLHVVVMLDRSLSLCLFTDLDFIIFAQSLNFFLVFVFVLVLVAFVRNQKQQQNQLTLHLYNFECTTHTAAKPIVIVVLRHGNAMDPFTFYEVAPMHIAHIKFLIVQP